MQYPKQIMTITELSKLGFPRDYLLRVVHAHGQTFAKQMSRGKSSKWLFDTESFEKWRAKQ